MFTRGIVLTLKTTFQPCFQSKDIQKWKTNSGNSQKGKTLEEMDEVFASGVKPWKAGRKGSRFDDLQRDIEAGNVRISMPLRRVSEVPCLLHIEDRSSHIESQSSEGRETSVDQQSFGLKRW